MNTTHRRRTVLVAGVGVLACLAGTAVLSPAATSAVAAPADLAVSDVSLTWGLSGEQGGGAFFGGCNFLSAGTAGDAGSSRLWTSADGFYRPTDGAVRIEKPDAAGAWSTPTWTTKCEGPDGAPVNAASTTSLTHNRVVFGGGVGTVDPAAGTASVTWRGSFTSVFYGGLTSWSAADPTLTVSDGTATVTATVSGHGADMADPTRWVALAPRTVTLATVRQVTLGPDGFTGTPDYLGTAVTTPAGGTPQAPRDDANRSIWGSFPQSFVDFQQLTGQSSYWFTSGGSRDAAKPATPVTVGWEVATAPTPPPTDPVTTPPPTDPVTTPPTDPVPTAPVPTDPVPTDLVPTPPTVPAPAIPGGAPSGCVPIDAVTAGALTWGFKQSFRGYVAGAAGTSITAAGGARILASDLAVASRPDSGTIGWPFASSTSYTSSRSFAVAYGGAVTFSYPSHFFRITISEPRLQVTDGRGTLLADVSSTVTTPGTSPVTDTRRGVTLASVTLAGSSSSPTAGTTLTAGVAIEDTSAFSLNGTAFYQRGQALDDATVVLADCALPDPATGSDPSGAGAGAVGTGATPDLVPPLRYRPSALPVTGADTGLPLGIGAAAVLAGTGLLAAAGRTPCRRARP